MLERRLPKESNLSHIGRTQSGQSALALDGFNHRGFFATDIRPCAAPNDQLRQRFWIRLSEFFNCCVQNFNHTGVLVPDIEITAVDAHHLCRNQHPFQKAVGIALQVITILECARLSFIDIDGHQSGSGLFLQNPPLASRREPGAAQPPKPR